MPPTMTDSKRLYLQCFGPCARLQQLRACVRTLAHWSPLQNKAGVFIRSIVYAQYTIHTQFIHLLAYLVRRSLQKKKGQICDLSTAREIFMNTTKKIYWRSHIDSLPIFFFFLFSRNETTCLANCPVLPLHVL